MADTAHKSPEDVKEFEEDPSVVHEKAKKLAQWIRESSNFVVFTGAGISTSAGIPDFRGPKGVWTLRAQGKSVPRGKAMSCVPTKSHMTLVALERAGLLKFLVSQNTDGLHRKSGFPQEKLAELHGNGGLEYCRNCKKEYMRDFRCRRAGNKVHDHLTGRACPACRGPLLDSIINFGESLPERHLAAGMRHGRSADLMLVLGSSLTVTPAAEIPQATTEAAPAGRLVIVNLQRTPMDRRASLRVFAKTDVFMAAVAEALDLSVPAWALRRRFAVSVGAERPRATVEFAAETADGLPLSLFAKVEVGAGREGAVLAREPFRSAVAVAGGPVRCRLHFHGHHGEPAFELVVDPRRAGRQSFEIRFDLELREWQRVQADDGEEA